MLLFGVVTFAAWCDWEYGFEYEAVRQRKGLGYA